MSLLRSSRLMAGNVPRAELSEKEAKVAEILATLRAPIHGETDGEEDAVAAIVAALANGREPSVVTMSRRTDRGRSTLKIAVVTVVILLGATSAAAADGSLPHPLQRAAARLLSHVGLSVPNPDDPPRPDPSDGDESGTAPLPVTNPSDHRREPGRPANAPARVPGDVPTTPTPASGNSGPLVPAPGSDPQAARPATPKPNPTTTTTKPQGVQNGAAQSSGANSNGVAHATPRKAPKPHGPTK